ncbi:MAG: hypothetical protein NT062_33895 [Proteobacteria bacterium]|nr:hypothetical protein [Pseudomonadota bacterium]
MTARIRTVVVIATTLVACDGQGQGPIVPIVPISSIARDVGKRLGVAVEIRCGFLLGMPTGCLATLPDRTAIPIVVQLMERAWDWRFDGTVISTAPIARYIADELAAAGGRPRDVACAPQIRRVVPQEQLECTLGGGGIAFVTLGADGAVAELELELDPLAAAARGEIVSAARQAELDRMSRALQHTEADEGNDERNDVDDESPDDASIR